MAHEKPWWQRTSIYQIYPRSYRDSNGDGIGDIPGIIEKLDYIHDMGFETIWISPFYTSPQEDWGYDVSGYRDIAPEYGSLRDVEHLINEVHRRGMKVLFDLVLNHTSIQHPWFTESCSGRDNPKSDWYIWRDGAGANRPPNNWKAIPGGSGWHFHPGRGQWYYASFLPFQPDLNYRNLAVKDEMFKVVKYWLDKGVDGFRLDIFHAIYKADHFKNNPFHWSFMPKDDKYGYFTEWKYTISQPETIGLAHELRKLLDSYSPQRFMIGEIFGEDKLIRQYLGDNAEGMHAIFLWKMMDYRFQASFFWDVLNHYETWYPAPFQPVLVLGNHDSRRWIDRIAGSFQKAKLISLLQLTARGISVVYYGEEIGLPEGELPAKNALDPVGRRYSWIPKWLLDVLGIYTNRDNCRTPMVWSDSPRGGFTEETAELWLPLSADPRSANVAAQADQPNSLLNWYKSVLNLRQNSSALRDGSLSLLSRQLAQNGLLGFFRQSKDEKIGVLINFSNRPVEVDLKASRILLQTGTASLSGSKVNLASLSCAVIEMLDS